jgi:hypothetical protein
MGLHEALARLELEARAAAASRAMTAEVLDAQIALLKAAETARQLGPTERAALVAKIEAQASGEELAAWRAAVEYVGHMARIRDEVEAELRAMVPTFEADIAAVNEEHADGSD